MEDFILTNAEVLKLTQRSYEIEPNRGSRIDLSPEVDAIKFTVRKYLGMNGTGNANLKTVENFLIELKKLTSINGKDISKKEAVQLANLGPKSEAELCLIVEDCEERFKAETINRMLEIIGQYINQK